MSEYLGKIDLLNTLLIAAIVALLTVSLNTLLRGRRRLPQGPVQIKLRELATLWTNDGKREVHISELAPLWRDENTLTAGADFDSLTFNNQRIIDFVSTYVKNAPWFRNSPLQATVALKILSMLDKEGDCPSVVNVSGDVEATWDASTYGTLARVTLRDHSLNVADEAVKALRQSDAAHIIPDALIAALGHDLGKLASSRGYLYSLGEHPLAAGKAMATIPQFKGLPKKDEILRAIKLHHKMPEGLLGKTIKQADQRARQRETEEVLTAMKDAEEKQYGISCQTAQSDQTSTADMPASSPAPPHLPPPSPPSNVENNVAAWRAEEAIYDIKANSPSSEKKKSLVTGGIKMMDISSWFDASGFLESLKPYINRMYGKRWMAFSMSDGHVYIQAKAIEEVARRQAEKAGAMDIATMAPDDETMRQVLFTVVNHLRVEHQGVIARELIKDQFFGGYFMINTKAGKQIKGFYTPFHAEAFGSIAEMEAEKRGTLKEFKSVELAC